MSQRLSLLPTKIEEQIVHAYKVMAEKVRYRPAVADGDEIALQRKNLTPEAKEYAQRWWEEEEECSYYIGCPDWSYRVAMMYAIEATRLMCGAPWEKERISKLLSMASEAAKR